MENRQNDVVMVDINKLGSNNRPATPISEEALRELADAIKEYGLAEPIMVVNKADYYEIIAGERRWIAAKMAGLKEVPVTIKTE